MGITPWHARIAGTFRLQLTFDSYLNVGPGGEPPWFSE